MLSRAKKIHRRDSYGREKSSGFFPRCTHAKASSANEDADSYPNVAVTAATKKHGVSELARAGSASARLARSSQNHERIQAVGVAGQAMQDDRGAGSGARAVPRHSTVHRNPGA